MDVQIETLPDLRVACRRVLGPYAETRLQAWKELSPWMGRKCPIDSETLFLGICHDIAEFTPLHDMKYDAAVTVPEHVLSDGFITVRHIPAGEYASFLYQGPHDVLDSAWAALYWKWLPSSGRTPQEGPLLELYMNDPQLVSDEKLLTKLYMPLAPLHDNIFPSSQETP